MGVVNFDIFLGAGGSDISWTGTFVPTLLIIMLVIRDGTVTQVSGTLVYGAGWEDTGNNNGVTGVF